MRRVIRILIVIVALALVGGGGYWGYQRFFSQTKPKATATQQVVPVARQTLQATITANGSVSLARQAKLTFGSAGTVTEVSVRMGDAVKQGQVLAKLDTKDLVRAVAKAELALSTAQLDLQDAKNPYTASDIADARAAVRNAQSALEVAQDNLNNAKNPYSETDIALARAALEQAKMNRIVTQKSDVVSKNVRDRENEHNAYEVAYGDALVKYNEGKIDQERLDGYWSNLLTAKEKLDTAIQQATLAVSKAESDVAKVQDALDKMLVGPDSLVVKQKENEVAKAQDALRQAEEKLAEVLAGPDPDNVKRAENKVTDTQTALDAAKDQLTQATVTAPFDGVVAQVGAQVSDKATASTVMVLLVDPKVVEVNATVDEIDVAQVKPGQEATFSLDALPGVQLKGKVNAVSPIATRVSGVTSYALNLGVNVNPETPQGRQTMSTTQGRQTMASAEVQLSDGMTAVATIVTQKRENVLVVPNRAIKGTGRNRTVQVQVGNEQQQRTIRTGMNDDQWTEVLEGLQEGDRVIVETTTTTTQPRIGGSAIPGMQGGPSIQGGPSFIPR